jgi:hypothetical protein
VSFHEQYVAASASRLPHNLRPWPDLEETFRQANLQQAQYSIRILEAAGFEVHPGGGTPKDFEGFTKEEIERMAELEHGRWNIERLRDGWRYGKPRDDSRKIHDCLVSWQELPDALKVHDRVAVAAFPSILAKAKMEVRRR